MLRIKFTYCGGCNPRTDFSQVIEHLTQKATDIETGQEKEIEVLVNGCPVQCKEAHSNSIDLWKMFEQEWTMPMQRKTTLDAETMADTVLAKIKDMLLE